MFFQDAWIRFLFSEIFCFESINWKEAQITDKLTLKFNSTVFKNDEVDVSLHYL